MNLFTIMLIWKAISINLQSTDIWKFSHQVLFSQKYSFVLALQKLASNRRIYTLICKHFIHTSCGLSISYINAGMSYITPGMCKCGWDEIMLTANNQLADNLISSKAQLLSFSKFNEIKHIHYLQVYLVNLCISWHECQLWWVPFSFYKLFSAHSMAIFFYLTHAFLSDVW